MRPLAVTFPKRISRFRLRGYPGLVISLHRNSPHDFYVMTTDACGLVIKSAEFTAVSRTTATEFMRDWLTANYPELN